MPYPACLPDRERQVDSEAHRERKILPVVSIHKRCTVAISTGAHLPVVGRIRTDVGYGHTGTITDVDCGCAVRSSGKTVTVVVNSVVDRLPLQGDAGRWMDGVMVRTGFGKGVCQLANKGVFTASEGCGVCAGRHWEVSRVCRSDYIYGVPVIDGNSGGFVPLTPAEEGTETQGRQIAAEID
ncbi:MAG: hypothetical protein KatS3mg056_1009 [Chloroflexus sp.]|nr:MAG: hypothetical protein KatS3mg056_1009 [Chloroflexus sp.]